MIVNTIIILGLVYFLLCALLYWKQESLIFHPTKLDTNYSFSQYSNFEEIYFPIKEGKIHALHFKTPNPKGIVLYFHGNSLALESWGYAAQDFTSIGYEVLMPDYRTYGKSTGTLSEKGLNEDALMVYNYLLDKWPASKIILYGRSLGSGIATELATKVEAKLLILETPYTSIPAMANKTVRIVPVKGILNYRFRNIVKMKLLKCPVHIFAATDDQLTPYKHAVALARKTGDLKSNLTSIEGAVHNNIGAFKIYHQKLKELLEQ